MLTIRTRDEFVALKSRTLKVADVRDMSKEEKKAVAFSYSVVVSATVDGEPVEINTINAFRGEFSDMLHGQDDSELSSRVAEGTMSVSEAMNQDM